MCRLHFENGGASRRKEGNERREALPSPPPPVRGLFLMDRPSKPGLSVCLTRNFVAGQIQLRQMSQSAEFRWDGTCTWGREERIRYGSSIPMEDPCDPARPAVAAAAGTRADAG